MKCYSTNWFGSGAGQWEWPPAHKHPWRQPRTCCALPWRNMAGSQGVGIWAQQLKDMTCILSKNIAIWKSQRTFESGWPFGPDLWPLGRWAHRFRDLKRGLCEGSSAVHGYCSTPTSTFCHSPQPRSFSLAHLKKINGNIPRRRVDIWRLMWFLLSIRVKKCLSFFLHVGMKNNEGKATI